MTAARTDTTLITGATGYLGGLVAAALAASGSARVILLVRGKHDPAVVAARIRAEVAHVAGPRPHGDCAEITVAPVAGVLDATAIVQAVRRFGVSEVVHCAGCVSYWNAVNLQAGNVTLTAELLEAARRLRVRRFVYLSSAFCSGYLDGPVGETLHTGRGVDPCLYTTSKRDAEQLVAESGLPYLMIRPSIVIGDSHTGRYTGKLSGLYQLLWAARRYLFGRSSTIHAVAPELPLHLLHQDAFQAGFSAAHQHLPDNAIIHLVSREATLPTVRQLWGDLVDRYLPERDVRFHDSLRGVPLSECSASVRQFLTAVQTNVEISSHPWRFESLALECLRRNGLAFRDATLATTALCRDQFLATSERSEVCAAVGDEGDISA